MTYWYLGVRNHAKCGTSVTPLEFSQLTFIRSTVSITPVLQTRKLGLRGLVQGHTVGIWKCQDRPQAAARALTNLCFAALVTVPDMGT